MFHVPNELRVRRGPYGSDDSYGNNGVFYIKIGRREFMVMASDGLGWEHVSVSLPNRCPTWEEMCKIKDMFWGKHQTVIQYHPAEDNYVNNFPFCLHLWRPIDKAFPMPNPALVGVN